MSANDKQVGGQHYGPGKGGIQHWDFVEQNGLGYLEGCATKYIARNRKKHPTPVEDLGKAVHYIEKLQELERAGVKVPRPDVPLVISVADFADTNDLTGAEETAVRILTVWKHAADLQTAWEVVWAMYQDARKGAKPA